MIINMCAKTVKIYSFLFVLQFFVAINTYAEIVERLKIPVPVADFNLTDQGGATFSKKDFVGQWSLVFLGFTTCPDICPMTMSQLSVVRSELGLHFTPEKIPSVVFVAVDPDRDEPVLAEYLSYFHPDNIGITGKFSELDALVKSIDGYYRLEKEKNEKNYTVVHSASIAVINSSAEYVAKINPPFDINTTARELMLLIRRSGVDD